MPPLRNKELDLELGNYSGVVFKQAGMTFGRAKPFEIMLYANAQGTFEASVALTLEDAESIRTWLTEFLADEAKKQI